MLELKRFNRELNVSALNYRQNMNYKLNCVPNLFVYKCIYKFYLHKFIYKTYSCNL